MREVFCSALGLWCFVASAMAQHGPGGFLTADDAGLIARDYGVAKIEEIELDDGIWEVDGRDQRGREFNVDIDAATGAVIKIDRD